jgi:UDP-N-acetylglucosamine 2-epimerase
VLTRLQLAAGRFFVVSAHREENIDSEKNFASWSGAQRVAEHHGLPGNRLHPSAHAKAHRRHGRRVPPAGAPAQAAGLQGLQQTADDARSAVLSDSGTITEESSILNFPALNMREAHERPEGMEEAAVMMVGLEVERVMQAWRSWNPAARQCSACVRQVADYSMPNVRKRSCG